MYPSRRGFLNVFIQGSTGMLLMYALRWKKNDLFEYKIRCQFPQPLSEEEFSKIRSSWEDVDKLAMHMNHYKKNGQLLSHSYNFHSTHTEMKLVFRSKLGFIAWETGLWEKNIFNDSIMHQKGFRAYMTGYKLSGSSKTLCLNKESGLGPFQV